MSTTWKQRQSRQPVGLRMIRLQRCQRIGIRAAHISPLFPYIFPICASKSSKSVLALTGFKSNRCFAIEHLSSTGCECRFFGDVPDARQFYVWLVVNVFCKDQESPLIVSEIGQVSMWDVRQTAGASSRILCKSICICDCRNSVASSVVCGLQ